jgi:hypothetical protein
MIGAGVLVAIADAADIAPQKNPALDAGSRPQQAGRLVSLQATSGGFILRYPITFVQRNVMCSEAAVAESTCVGRVGHSV